MLQTLPDRTKQPRTVVLEKVYKTQHDTITRKTPVPRKSNFRNIMDTCYELQSTVDSI